MKLALVWIICIFILPFNAFGGDLEGQKIILIGDSQIEGSWSNVGPELETILRKRGANVVRLGIGGSASKVWYKTLLGKPHYLSKRFPHTRKWTYDFLRQHKPDQIIVSLGGNSTWIGKYGKNRNIMDKYHFNYTLSVMLHLKHITPNIIWFGPSHRWRSAHKAKRKRIRHGHERTNYFLQYYAKRSEVKYVSMLNWATQNERTRHLSPKEKRYDGVHYRGIPARCYAETIASNIKRN